jgi:hypothetical protein
VPGLRHTLSIVKYVSDAAGCFSFLVPAAAYRSVHGYRVVGRKRGGWVRWERWVERQFVLSLSFPPCLEVALPAAAPRILPAGWRTRPVFREGQTVEDTWRCIVAFDSVAAVAPSSPPPPVLSPLVYGQSDHISSKPDAALLSQNALMAERFAFSVPIFFCLRGSRTDDWF